MTQSSTDNLLRFNVHTENNIKRTCRNDLIYDSWVYKQLTYETTELVPVSLSKFWLRVQGKERYSRRKGGKEHRKT